MRRVSNGYTIVELLIVLGVTTVIFVASVGMLNGRVANNRFSESMRDLKSKVDDVLNDTTTGFPGGNAGNYRCDVTGSGGGRKVQIKNPAGPYNPNCIFLGKAIQFTDQATDAPKSKIMNVYSVFGQRVPEGSNQPVSILSDALPTAAIGQNANYGGTQDLTLNYAMEGGAYAKSVLVSSGVANSHLGGFYNNFNTSVNSTTNGNQDIKAYQYPIPSTTSIFQIFDCINMTSCSAGLSEPPKLSSWKICLANNSNSQTAVLTISSNNGVGVTTDLTFTPC